MDLGQNKSGKTSFEVGGFPSSATPHLQVTSALHHKKDAVDLNIARQFLSALGMSENWTFQTFDDGPGKNNNLARIFHGSLNDHWRELDRLNARGAGIFLTINETDGRGRKKENIKRVRALFADFDKVDSARDFTQLGLEPSIVIESSPHRHHAYWLVENWPLELFSDAQQVVSRAFDSDYTIHDLSRVMRLPGFYHQKGEKFLVRILQLSGNRYDQQTIEKWLEHLGLVASSLRRSAVFEDRYAQKALYSIIAEISAASEGTRNDTLNRQACGAYGLVLAGRLQEDAVTLKLTEAAAVAGLSEIEIKATLNSARKGAQPRYDGITIGLSGQQWPKAPAEIIAGGCTIEEAATSEQEDMQLVLDPGEPLESAKAFVRNSYMTQGFRSLRYWQENFYGWSGRAYVVINSDDLRAAIYDFLSQVQEPTKIGVRPFRPTTQKVNNVIDALKAVANLPAHYMPPCWLDDSGRPAAEELIACKNGLFHMPSSTLHPHDPSFFSLNALSFEHHENTAVPGCWLNFLDQIWPSDQESIAALQEIFGYLLTPDTSQQKIPLIVGPMRSGKGTIARVLTALLGQQNVAGPTMASLAQNFGLATLIGKQVAIISDARLGARADQYAITERLLAISGEDSLSIPRKFMSDYTAKLSVRFFIMTNELPRLVDASGALASRFIILTMQRSFYGKEDPGLTSKLLAELPGILNWAIDGWHRLQTRGYFVQPKISTESVQELADLSSPISAFVRECCVLNTATQIECSRLYGEWKKWCEEQGREHPGTMQTFGRDLRAAVPGLKTTQPRGEGGRSRLYCGIGMKDWHAMARMPPHCTHDSDDCLYSREYNAMDRVPSRATVMADDESEYF